MPCQLGEEDPGASELVFLHPSHAAGSVETEAPVCLQQHAVTQPVFVSQRVVPQFPAYPTRTPRRHHAASLTFRLQSVSNGCQFYVLNVPLTWLLLSSTSRPRVQLPNIILHLNSPLCLPSCLSHIQSSTSSPKELLTLKSDLQWPENQASFLGLTSPACLPHQTLFFYSLTHPTPCDHCLRSPLDLHWKEERGIQEKKGEVGGEKIGDLATCWPSARRRDRVQEAGPGACREGEGYRESLCLPRKTQDNLGTWKRRELLKAGGDIKAKNMRTDWKSDTEQ